MSILTDFVKECREKGVPHAHGNYSPEVREMLDTATECICCGKHLKASDYKRITTRGYCSMECFRKVTPRIAYAMKELNIEDFDTYALKVLNETQNISLASELLGMNRTVFAHYMRNKGMKKKIVFVMEGNNEQETIKN